MKGTTLVGELIAFLFMIAIGYVLTGITVYGHGVATTVTAAAGTADFNLKLTGGYFPVENEIALLSLLESQYNDVAIKKILTYVLMQNTIKPEIDGSAVDAEIAVRNILNRWQGQKLYMVRLRSSTGIMPILPSSGSMEQFKKTNGPVTFQKVEAKVFSPFDRGTIELYVFG